MAVSPIDIAAFAALLAILAGAGWRQASSVASFTVASRDLSLFPLVATLVMTEFNTSTLLAFASAGYGAGPMALALPAVFLVGLLFYTLTVARAWKRFDRLSVAELFTVRYSKGVGRTASLLLLLAMTGFTATYVKSLTLLFTPLAPAWMPVPLLSAVLSLVVLLAVLPGGLVSIVRADMVAFLATIVLLPLLLVLGMKQSALAGGLTTVFPTSQLTVNPIAQWESSALPMRFVSTLMVITCFTYIAAPWYGQKIFAARNTKVAFRAVGLSAVLVFLLYGAVVLAAAHLRASQPLLADPQLAVPTMVLVWLPRGLRGFAYAVLFGAALTTLAGVWSAMATMIAADFGGPKLATVSSQRSLIILFAFGSWLGATFLVDRILDRLILANIPVAALSFALLAGFHWPRATTAGAWASMIVGMAWGVGCYLVVGETGGYTWPWAMYGIPLIFAVGIITSLLTSTRAAPAMTPMTSSSP
ncbi:sodium:solute symporter family protein [Gemmatimonas sp.]|uniref:sodium:solute symporter family protein n=1 Tax=Gemmatimonas sp. TaxID=1962908 RepID=UPI003983C74D